MIQACVALNLTRSGWAPLLMHGTCAACSAPEFKRSSIVDGAGNDPVLLRLATDTLVALLQAKSESLLFCSAGMSRTPVIAAAAIATIECLPFAVCLERITTGESHDVAAGLAFDVEKMLRDDVG